MALRLAAALFAACLGAGTLQAQQPPTPPPPRPGVPLPPVAGDSLPGDRTRADTVKVDSMKVDTVKSPLAVPERPAMPEVRGRQTVWDRDALFASGALTLTELLALVPGVTTYQASFIAAPSVASWYGEPGRVRVFLDGVELDALDPREGVTRDLSVIQLWSLEEVAVERAAGELRVHLRSWRVRLTTPQTRTDILTGSENTNLYRGFFGKRMQGGGALQVAAQQYSTTSVRTAGDGDALAAFARAGVARGRLSVDAVVTRLGRTRSATKRNVLVGTLDPAAIAPFKGSDVAAYVRAGWGNADSSAFWAQVVAATLSHTLESDSAAGIPDSVASQSQYVATLGVNRGPAHLSATARMRAQAGEMRLSPSVRGSWENRWFALTSVAESGGADSTSRLDGMVLLRPFPWLHLSGAHSVHTPANDSIDGPARTVSRAEVGVRLWDRWVTAGVVERSAALVQGMPVFDPDYTALLLPKARGLEAGLAGPIRGPFSFSWRGVQWDADLPYRPSVESRTEIRVSTALERWLKRRTFHLSASAIHEYRGAFEAPDGLGGVERAEGASTVATLLDIRIGAAHIFWYNRNPSGKVYETVPGFLMPRLVQLYGIRWQFWN